MPKLLLTAAVLAAAALPAVPANAQGTSHHVGECRYWAVMQEQFTGPVYEGVMFAAVGLYGDPATEPVTATVTCYLRINGSTVNYPASATGTGAVVVAGRVVFAVASTDLVEMCTVVDFADATPTSATCVPRQKVEVGGPVADAVDALFSEVVDPWTCAALAAAGPATYGPVTVAADGDVAVAREPVWSCAPHDT